MKEKIKSIKVDYLARVEGEGALHVKIKEGKVTDVRFNIFEPPRFFEAFLRGRHFTEAPDITARICGICPVAYQMSAVHAMENALSVSVDGQLRALRRLIYCGEWIESHALHVYMLHAPDFLGYQDAIEMARDYPEMVKQGLRLKKIGNELVTLIGGREIHPINVKVGGFYKLPTKADLAVIAEKLTWARSAAHDMIDFTARLDFPDFKQDYQYVALRHPDEYPFCEGRIVSNKGLDISVEEYENFFQEEHVKHSTSLHSLTRNGEPYATGPLARYSLNFDRLYPDVQRAATGARLSETCFNPFKSIIVRSVETLQAVEEATRIIEAYQQPEKACVDIEARESRGCGCTEAPRGSLYHRYTLDAEGTILNAKIVPPTSQNQKIIESDLWHFVPENLNLSHDDLTWKCEQVIRNYDPCISCSCHFLNLTVERG
ncbi:MAG: Ni/Fe hydrogenase subunit alpha [Candidatus Zixiibacteriota bacterium]|nr:MAG: Ni/Fe hydrogenase subunit alpha [candidate division Zixibacteria bacterium]